MREEGHPEEQSGYRLSQDVRAGQHFVALMEPIFSLLWYRFHAVNENAVKRIAAANRKEPLKWQKN